MARKFRLTSFRIPLRRRANRCAICGRIIPEGYVICQYCSRRRTF